MGSVVPQALCTNEFSSSQVQMYKRACRCTIGPAQQVALITVQIYGPIESKAHVQMY